MSADEVVASDVLPGTCFVFHLQVQLPDRMRGIPFIEADLKSDADGLKNEFDEFLLRIFHVMQENRDAEELNIMNQRQ